jgi:histidine triad (HIT) family protein
MAAEEHDGKGDLHKDNCIFCKIISKEIPSKIVHEDEDVLAILDINPASNGHVLILPKKHYIIMPQIPKREIEHIFIAAKKMSLSLLKGLAVQGTTTFVANGSVAGQKSPHFMVHIIPRIENDGLFRIPKSHAKETELDIIGNKIASRLNLAATKQAKPITQEKVALAESGDVKPNPPQQALPEVEAQKAEKPNPQAGQANLDDIARLFG